MDRFFDASTHKNQPSLEIDNSLSDKFAFQEKIFLDAYGLNGFYIDAFRQIEQRLLFEIIFLDALYRYYCDFNYPYFTPRNSKPRPSTSNNKSHLYRWVESDAQKFLNLQGKSLAAIAQHNLGKPVWAFTKFAPYCERGNFSSAAGITYSTD